MSTPEIGIKLVLDGKEYRVGMTAAAADAQRFGQTAGDAMQRVGAAGRSIEAATSQVQAFGRGLQATGVSAAQTAAALRTLPAQFTDIATSLASGQNPFTVLLQQGGQIKDSFGGVGAAARAMGGYIAGLVNPFTVAAGAAALLGVAFVQGASEASELAKALIMSGNAAGVSASQLSVTRQRVADLVGTQANASQALADLVGTGKVGYETLGLAAEVAVRAQRILGTKTEETAKQFASLAGEPVQAAIKLNDSIGFLTASTLRQIIALDQQGKSAEATRVAQEALGKTLNERLQQAEQNLGTLERAWNGVKDAAKGAWDRMLNIGRPETIADQLAKASVELAALNDRKGLPEVAEGRQPLVDARRAQLQFTIANLQQQLTIENAIAAAKGETAKAAKAGVEFEAQGLQFLTKKEQMEKEIATARELGATAGLKQEEIEKRIAAIREKYTDKAADNAAKRELEERARLLAELAGLSGSFAKDWERLSSLYRSGALSLSQLVELQAQLLGKQPGVRAGVEAEQQAREAVTKAIYDEDAARIDALNALDKQVMAQIEHNREIGLTRDELARLKITRVEEALAIDEATLANRRAAGARADELSYLQEVIDKRRQLIGLMREGADKDAQVEADKEADKARKQALKEYEREAKRVADTVDRALTDGLMRGFEAGKGFAENFRDTLVNMFKTLVLRPVVSFIVQPISNSIAAVLGGSPVGGGSSSFGSMAGPLSSLSSINSLITTGAGGSVGSIVGGIGNIVGSSSISAFGTGMGLTSAQAAEAASAYQAAGMSNVAGQIQAGQMAGVAAGYAAGIGVGITAGATISNGYGRRGVVNVGTAIGAVVGGPIGAAIGGAIGGLVNRAFGSRPQETTARGFEGTFTADGFSGRQFSDWQIKGGWFSRDRSGRDFSALTAEQQRMLSGAVDAAPFAQLSMLAGMGPGADRLKGWSFAVNRAIATDEDFKKLLTDVSDSIGRTVVPGLEAFKAEGESLAQTAQRLTGVFAATSDIASILGKRTEEAFGAIGLAGADARQALVDAAGGLDALTANVSTYYNAFYTDAEKQARLGKQLGETMIGLGLRLPETRAGFRALVESLDLTTDSGRRAFATLTAASSAADQYYKAIESGTGSLKAAARQIAESLKGVAASLRSTIDGVLGTGSPETALNSLSARFDAVYASAKVSTGDALSTYASQLSDLINPLLQAGTDYYASGPEYQALRQYVLDRASAIAMRLDEEAGSVDRGTKPVLTAPPSSPSSGTGGSSVAVKTVGATPPTVSTGDSQMAALIAQQGAGFQATVTKLEEVRAELVEMRRYLSRQAAAA